MRVICARHRLDHGASSRAGRITREADRIHAMRVVRCEADTQFGDLGHGGDALRRRRSWSAAADTSRTLPEAVRAPVYAQCLG